MHEGLALLLGGCPPLSPLYRGPLPLPTWHAVRAGRTLFGGYPFIFLLLEWDLPPPFPSRRAWRVHAAWGVLSLPPLVQGLPPPSILHAVHKMRMLRFGGVPLLILSLAACWGSALPDWGAPLSLVCARMVRALQFGGVPLLLLPLAAR